MTEDVLRLSGAANLALATSILRTLLDKNYIDLKEASAVCHFVADTIIDVPASHEIANMQAALWKELSNTFERQRSYV
ncbi:hypothetical protein [Methylobacterium haplocladii]|uniref:Uncharacterized protein n=2 Tax=Methylobacterium haplocladii TaxID=1176176 RepID=A0A512ITP5_9HYPH|nr:hypothetical protein [Methylobacterium haplocladii]GEP01082.1 hypothetical protein MHA02_34690 [Methylobacterium haplocladii]GLS60041.1 hypothetical protein GCM10007887_27170 [Methylobacterium haplocladii]